MRAVPVHHKSWHADILPREMWRRHLEVLRCPECGGGLDHAGEGDWIEDGELACAQCPASYPVVLGVARIFRSTAQGPAADPRTRAAFGFEWLTFPVTTADEDRFTFFALTGVEPRFHERTSYRNPFDHLPTAADIEATDTTFFAGKTVLDAGCGMGKYVSVVAGCGASLVVGLDASAAVERAVALTRAQPNALIVQGDIFRPPLAPVFDFAYSLGVLHHTPSPREAFRSVAACLGPAGGMAVWLYPRGASWPARLSNFWHDRITRALLSRLPHPVLKRICDGLGRVTVSKGRLARSGKAGRTLARVLGLVAVGNHWDARIAAFLNFDWYSPPFRSRHTQAELRGWYEQAGLARIDVLPEPVSAIGFRV